MIRSNLDSPTKRIVLVFIDGLGLGRADSPDNPLRHPELDLLANHLPAGWTPDGDGPRPEPLPAVERARPLPRGGVVRATDASLGVEGLPQSATGQTTLYTGRNGALALGGRHYTGFPTKTLKELLIRASIFRRLCAAGRAPVFLNAFTPLFFEMGDAIWRRPLGASTWAARQGCLPYRDFDDLHAGRAVFFDITHDTDASRILGLLPRAPEEAAEILAAVSREHDFTLFEFFLTDKAGHAQDRAWAERELTKLERFLAASLRALDLEDTLLVVTSDHGNVEDLGVKTHTVNPIPTLVFGPEAERAADRLGRLEDFTPCFLDLLGADGAARPDDSEGEFRPEAGAAPPA